MRRLADARRHRRVPVSIRVFAVDKARPADDVRDLSVGGFAVHTIRPLPPGTRSMFQLNVSHHDVPLQIDGEVVWTRLDGDASTMGVRITAAQAGEKQRLESFVDKLIKDADRL